MSIAVKYNHNLAFRRRVAFRRMYRAKDFQKRLIIELSALAVSALISLILWFSGSDAHFLIYVFFLTTVSAVYFLVRLLRAAMVALRVKPADGREAARAFYFDERGFTFGPVDEAGKMIETRWRDFDKVYITPGVVYILCMGRRHWAVVDRHLVFEGSWEELVSLLKNNLPKRVIAADKEEIG